MNEEIKKKPWIKEAEDLAQKISDYGFSVRCKVINPILMEEMNLSRKYLQPRGKSIRYEASDAFANKLKKNGYVDTGGFICPKYEAQSSERIFLESLVDLPENIAPEKLWPLIGKFFGGMQNNIWEENISDGIKPHFKNKKVIELGSGFGVLIKSLFSAGIQSYVGVDPFYGASTQNQITKFEKDNEIPKDAAKAVEMDGLTYLLKQPDNSAIIASNGLFCTELIGKSLSLMFVGNATDNDIHQRRYHERNAAFLTRYVDETLKQMFRVTEQGGFFYSDWHTFSDKTFTHVGFKQDEKLKDLFWKK